MQGIKKSLIAAVLLALLLMMPAAVVYSAGCSPSSAVICVASDDIATVYINNTYIGVFNYVNWDENGVYPPCMSFDYTLLRETGNYVAISVQNSACCEIWGSWSIETQCAGGMHSCITSDDAPMKLYNVATPSAVPPPDNVDGTHWYQGIYDESQHGGGWNNATMDTGTIFGKLIYNPCTGKRLQPLSYNAGGAADLPGSYIYMRQPFPLQTATPLGPANFTITKTLVGPAPVGGYNTNQRVTYVLNVCNTGKAEQGLVTLYDDFDNKFDFDGPYGGDCDGYGDGSPCNHWGSGSFTTTWKRGFPGNTCMNVTGLVVDYYVDSNEWCTTRSNVARIDAPVSTATSNTIDVSMYCPSTNTFTPTITMTRTITDTYTVTSTNSITSTMTPTSTKSRIPTWTNSPTQYPTNFTVTVTMTITVTPSFTRTYSPTVTPTSTVTLTWVNAITLIKSENGESNPAQGSMDLPLGDTVLYCIQFTNGGANSANFEIWDTIPGPMDFMWCSQESDGTDCDINTFSSGACYDFEGSPVHGCRVISWHLTNVPAGAVGSVCFRVLIARLQTADRFKMINDYFADLWDGVEKKYFDQDTGQQGVENLRNIRGPDKTD